jgi:NAD(P)-dependent dehydrogenase (short-subunit alcohol dehydrogenase family)
MACSNKAPKMSKVVVITGSEGGIGKALVKAYLDDNYFVIGLDRTYSHPNMEFMGAKNFTMLKADLLLFSRDAKYRTRVVDQIKSNIPDSITGLALINNAATQILKPTEEIQWDDWEQSLAVNSVAPHFLAQGLIKELSEHRGHIVNISSIHAKLTKSEFTCYAASKAALESITRSLALELSPLGVSVNAVAPAAIATDMLRAGFSDSPENLKKLEACHPSNSIGQPEDIAQFIKMITEHGSGFLTGSVLSFNGGISARLYDP